MSTRRIVMAVLVTMLMSALTAAPAAAAKPIKPPPATPAERPLTAEEEAAAAAKFAAAQAYVAAVAASGADLASLSCVTPTATTSAGGEATTDAIGDATIQGCYVPQGFITVYARDQDNGAYCAPATGQVIANYAWAVASWANKYSQADIARWMGTNGGTDAFGVERGLETATRGAPRRPGNWDWLVHDLRDLNGNGDTGDELFTALRANISGSAMPMAIAVKPHDPNAIYWLASWPRAVISPGHWIAAYGWVGIYSKGSNYSRMYFTDSSKDEGGSTGKFYNSVLSIKWMIDHHTRRFVW
ncbi:MAG TPA: hypothetical protein VFN76_03965 [Candidatus Limnocylindria bacterium]|nr:hypothetical protein [Candidatus Limnocylindria bacterium]